MLDLADLQKYAPKMLAVVRVAKQTPGRGYALSLGAQTDGTPNILPDRNGPAESNTFMHCATLYAGNPSSGVCAGRPDAATVKNKPKWDGKNPHAPASMYRWPRFFTDTSTDGSPKVNGGLGSLAWGEDCSGRKHFDCAGFVRYCFRQVLGPNAIPASGMKGSCRSDLESRAVPGGIESVEVWPADLLFDGSFAHVGIATGHWLLTGYGVTQPSYALHCYSATVGVLMTPIGDAHIVRWQHVFRWPKWA